MICERCGNNVSDTAMICSICGTAMNTASANGRSTKPREHSPQGAYSDPSTYQQGYTPRSAPSQQQSYRPSQPSQKYPLGGINITINNPVYPFGTPTATPQNEGALVAEILLSLFGIFGVGWLMAGETKTGLLLLICSFCVYWPFMILGTIFTLGIGLICLGPIAITCIIINALLLSSKLRHKSAHMVIMQPPSQQMPPGH